MKTLITALIALLILPTNAQTNVISLRSHAGNFSKINHEVDNFGEPPTYFRVDSVVYLGGSCILEIRHWTWGSNESKRDTICEHPAFNSRNFDLTDFQSAYPDNPTYVDFEKLNWEEKKTKKKKKDQSSTTVLVIVLSFLLLSYLVAPAYIDKKREGTQ
jgi:hypothetical protein